MNPGDLVHVPEDVLMVEYDCYASEQIFKYVDSYIITEKPELLVLVGPAHVMGYSKVVHAGRVWLVLTGSLFAIVDEEERNVNRIGASNLV